MFVYDSYILKYYSEVVIIWEFVQKLDQDSSKTPWYVVKIIYYIWQL